MGTVRRAALAIGSATTVALFFAPYLALPMGANTNLPLSAVTAALVALLGARLSPDAVLGAVLVAAVLPGLIIASVHWALPIAVASIATWLVVVATFVGSGVAVRTSPRVVCWTLSIGVLVSGGWGVAQKFLFLDRGVLPGIGYYDLPGYASVRAKEFEIVTYVRRPFGLFPEPSFMAGSLAIAIVALIMLRRWAEGSLRRTDLLAIAVGTTAIILSASGSAVASVGLIVVATFWARTRAGGRTVGLVVGGAAVYFVGRSILGERGSGNWSWGDRADSILSGFDYQTSNVAAALWGIGRGNSTVFYQSGEIPSGRFGSINSNPDMYSVLGRVVLENGLLAGSALVLGMALAIALPAEGIARTDRIMALAVWLIVAGLTVSYDSAAFIWFLPGALFGVRYACLDRHHQGQLPKPLVAASSRR